MLDLKKIRENLEEISSRLRERYERYNLAELLENDRRLRELKKDAEELKRERNRATYDISLLKKRGGDASDKINRMKEVSLKIKELDNKIKDCSNTLNKLLLEIPNVPAETVPTGKDAGDNKLITTWDKPKSFSFPVRSHVDIGQRLEILDFKRGAKIAGARFVLYKGMGAMLERALINFMLDIHINEHGYQEVIPPFLVNEDSITGTGQLPKFKEDLFYLPEEDYYLIPTAEVPVTNIFKDEIIKYSDLPVYFVSHTPCFRREAGSYGKDTTGLIRQHQFNKVELVKFVEPEKSYEELEKLLSDARDILERLDIPYRIVELCTGDLGFSAAKTYDIEVWLPSQREYREISSCSNFEDYQARRARIRYKRTPKSRPLYVHTLNGSGVAVGRAVVAILENYQQKDGTVTIPDVLRSYMNGIKEIKPGKG